LRGRPNCLWRRDKYQGECLRGLTNGLFCGGP